MICNDFTLRHHGMGYSQYTAYHQTQSANTWVYVQWSFTVTDSYINDFSLRLPVTPSPPRSVSPQSGYWHPEWAMISLPNDDHLLQWLGSVNDINDFTLRHDITTRMGHPQSSLGSQHLLLGANPWVYVQGFKFATFTDSDISDSRVPVNPSRSSPPAVPPPGGHPHLLREWVMISLRNDDQLLQWSVTDARLGIVANPRVRVKVSRWPIRVKSKLSNPQSEHMLQWSVTDTSINDFTLRHSSQPPDPKIIVFASESRQHPGEDLSHSESVLDSNLKTMSPGRRSKVPDECPTCHKKQPKSNMHRHMKTHKKEL
jgi:hypothetical protein